MQVQVTEGEGKEGGKRRCHVALASVWSTDPIADRSRLGDPATNVRERNGTHQSVVLRVEDKERIGNVPLDVADIALHSAAESSAGQVVLRPGGFPGRQKCTAFKTQRRPALIVAHFRHA